MGEVKVFDAPFSGREAAQKQIQLRQDSRSVADCAVEEVKDKLAAPELPTDLDFLIALTIRIRGDYGDGGGRRNSCLPASPGIPPGLRVTPEVPDGLVAERTRGFLTSLESRRSRPSHHFPSLCNQAELGCRQWNGITGST